MVWQGFNESEDTWEPLENLIEDVPDSVETLLREKMDIGLQDLSPIKYKTRDGERTYYSLPQ